MNNVKSIFNFSNFLQTLCQAIEQEDMEEKNIFIAPENSRKISLRKFRKDKRGLPGRVLEVEITSVSKSNWEQVDLLIYKMNPFSTEKMLKVSPREAISVILNLLATL